jgi:putative nucleotidyltransferase with HDIG domain
LLTLNQIVRRIQQIPPMPDVVLKVLELSEQPKTSVRDLVEVIRLDPGITFKVLRLCNSAHYGLPRKVSSLEKALVYLGNSTLVNFILTSYAVDVYQAATLGYGLEAGELWRHGVAAALAAELIADRVKVSDPGLLFTGALLHDVGKLILNEFVVAEGERIHAHVEKERCPFLDAEKAVLGFTHAEVGAQIASQWNLPPVLVHCILHHHDPESAEEDAGEVAIVHLSNTLALMGGFGIGSEGQGYMFEPKALERLGLRLEDLMGLSPPLHERFGKAVDLIRLNA